MTSVLLVDDNDRQRKLCTALLEDAGYQVQGASGALDALQSARASRPDVIVSDVMMDHLDGFGLCRRVRDDAHLASIPIVLVSAHYDDDAARALATSLGASALIQRTPDFSAEMQGISSCLREQVRVSKRTRSDSYEAHLETNANQLTKLVDEAKRAELRWRSLFDHAHDTLTLITPDGVIVEANQRWEEVLGVPASSLVGRHISEFDIPGEEGKNAASFKASLEKRVSTFTSIRHANGSVVHIEFAAGSVPIEGTNHVMAIGRDVTERVKSEQRAAAAEAARRKLEEQVAHSQRLETIGQMTGSIAHDFNNILGAILINAEVLVEDLAEGDPRRESAEEIRASTRRAAALTKHLLAFSRNQVLELTDLDVSSVVSSISRMVCRLIGPEIELRITDNTNAARVRADRVQLEQVIVNLAVNARDAMPGGGKLLVELGEVHVATGGALSPGNYVLLSVTDTGCGMTEETKLRVFEPFFTTKPRGHGTGLGLSTSFGIVKQLGGDIVVTSEVGVGTTLQVYLPCV